MSLQSKFVVGLMKGKYFIILFWIVVLAGTAYPAILFSEDVSQQMNPPKSSQAYKAKLMLRDQYSHNTVTTLFVMFFRGARESVSVMDGCRTGNCTFQRLDDELATATVEREFFGYTSFFTTRAQGFPTNIFNAYATTNGHAAFSAVVWKGNAEDQATKDAAKWLERTVKASVSHHFGLNVTTGVFSLPSFIDDIAESNLKDLVTMFGIVLPFALLVFAVSLSSLRLVIPAVLALVVTISASFGIMDGIAHVVVINSIAPGISACIAFAFVLDYSYLLTSSYKRHVRLQSESPVVNVLSTSLTSIVFSAVVLALCGVGMSLYPLDLYRSIGISFIFSNLVAMVVCITLVPALFVAFPKFFANGTYLMCPAEDFTEDEPSSGEYVKLGAHPSAQTPKGMPSLYHRSLSRVIRFPLNIIIVVVVVGACAFPMYKASGIHLSNDITHFLPRDSPVLPEWASMQRNFRIGEVFPYHLMINAKFGQSVLSQEFFSNAQDMLADMISKLPNTHGGNFESIFFDGPQLGTEFGGNVNVTDYNKLMLSGCLYNNELCKTPTELYRMVIYWLNAKDNPNNGTSMLVKLDFDPSSETGRQWYETALRLMATYEQKYGFGLFLEGYGAESYDSIHYAQRTLPQLAAVTSVILFLVVAVVYTSIVVPIRALATVALSVSTVYGISWMVSGEGYLNKINFDGLQGHGSIAWAVPLAVFLISVGISLSLELSVTTHVLGANWGGQPMKASIIQGVADTGSTVTVIAIMMSIVFAGLLFSTVPAMNEMGVYLVVASLTSAFLIRLLFTPALMGLLGKHNFFPMEWLRKIVKPLAVAREFSTPLTGMPLVSRDHQPTYATVDTF